MRWAANAFPAGASSRRRAFSRADLFATVVAVSGLLGLLALTLHQRVGPGAKGSTCQANLRSLTAAWIMDADASEELLLSSAPLPSDDRSGRRVWVTGNLNFAGAVNRENWDPDVSVGRSPLTAFLPPHALCVWRCPEDRSHVAIDGRTVPQFRSYSMSSVFDTGYWLPAFRYRTYAKRSEIAAPAQTFVLIDEHPDSLNDGAFAVQMVEPEATSGNIIDLPGTLHRGGSSLSFADGHAEHR